MSSVNPLARWTPSHSVVIYQTICSRSIICYFERYFVGNNYYNDLGGGIQRPMSEDNMNFISDIGQSRTKQYFVNKNSDKIVLFIKKDYNNR